jgi:hypothetical protein
MAKIKLQQYESAKGYVRSGGSINAIETKYKLTNEQRESLTKVKK